MKPIFQNWCIQIDITNYCFMSCLYCSRYNGHLRKDQRRHMTIEQFTTALDSLADWPAKIGIIGGEPLMHPQFREFCAEIQKRFPKDKMGLWTSGPEPLKRNVDIIQSTFGFMAYNEHSPEQVNVCRHQPLTISIKEAVPDESLRKQLIDDCWVQRTWCASINHFGAYFCECAAAQDVLLNDGVNAWPVTPGWWNKTPDMFQDQVDKFCGDCGMAIPMERELIKNTTEKFSPELLKKFEEKGLARLDPENVELFTYQFSREEIKQYAKRWTPGNYRGDLKPDETAPEGLGFTGVIE